MNSTMTSAVRTASLILALASLAAGLPESALASTHAATQSATSVTMTPNGIATDASGNIYISDSYHRVIDEVTPGGALSVVAGVFDKPGLPVPGPATASPVSAPAGLAVDSMGDLYIADDGDTQSVEKVAPSGVLSIVAGVPGQDNDAVNPGPATESELYNPTAVAVDPSGNLYIADTYHAVVSKVDASGNLSIVAGISDLLGSPTLGPATNSRLAYPTGVAVDGNGNLYIADTVKHEVLEVDSSGQLTILAGTGTAGAPTPGPASQSQLGYPAGLAVDSAGDLFIADSLNHAVEEVDPSGNLSVVAGTGAEGAPTVGPATESSLGTPAGVAVDSNGDLYIADTADNVVEKVDASGNLTVFAGTGSGLGVLQPAPVADATCFDNTLTGTYDDVTVPAGQACVLDGAHVKGSLTAQGATGVTVISSHIDQNLDISGTTGAAQVVATFIGGNASVDGNDGPVSFENNSVLGNVDVTGNVGTAASTLVLGNSVAGTSTCNGNTQLAVGCNAGTGGVAPQVMISEFRFVGPGGLPGDDYVELSNQSGSDVDLAGWFLQYALSNGDTATVELSGSLASGGQYLVADSGYDSGGDGFTLTPNITQSLGGTPVGVQLDDAGGATVDAVGFTDAPSGYYAGTPLSYPELYPPGEFAWVRVSNDGSLVNSGDNADDFTYVSQYEFDNSAYGNPTIGEPAPIGSPTQLTTLSSVLTGGGSTDPEIVVASGTGVSSQASVSGLNASQAGGSVTYSVYSDAACTIPATSSITVPVTDGMVPTSGSVNLPAGVYYWSASYSGSSGNAPSSTGCGAMSEVVLSNQTRGADVGVGLSVLSSQQGQGGTEVPIDVTVSDFGPKDAANVLAALRLPADVSVVDPDFGAQHGRLLIWQQAKIPAGQTISFQAVVAPHRGATGTAELLAGALSLGTVDPRYSNNLAATQLTLSSQFGATRVTGHRVGVASSTLLSELRASPQMADSSR